MTLNVVAALLTITGYSVNDTIVIFDRVRENLRGRCGASPEQGRQLSVNQTLGRTVITVRHDLPRRAGPVHVRRRGAARLRVHDARRRRHRHLLDRVHRGDDCHHPERAPGVRGPRREHRSQRPPAERGRAAGATCGFPRRRARAVLLLEAALLGVVQGLTEFLPVSSSAHLILARTFFGWDARAVRPARSTWPATSARWSRSWSTSGPT